MPWLVELVWEGSVTLAMLGMHKRKRLAGMAAAARVAWCGSSKDRWCVCTKWERERNVEGRVCGRTGTVLGRDGLKDEDAQQEQTDRLAPSWHRGAEGGKSFAVNTQSRAKEPTDRSLAMRRRNKVSAPVGTWLGEGTQLAGSLDQKRQETKRRGKSEENAGPGKNSKKKVEARRRLNWREPGFRE
ncbi:hypothetical protein CCM_08838 [Cordyceps militaris CM01]|uniref:Uncharacterized protein n=1 Tax=Cordyceps militaris (strain CM01) TaxID=983644 RepID=G3JS93_CORMM|nr:uncharacterized protein CCM_08838 [Cordyceps militaris CM01]EGX88792.1 hypothetical protein CCM_08838 [Cordyceps militaris CM01]